MKRIYTTIILVVFFALLSNAQGQLKPGEYYKFSNPAYSQRDARVFVIKINSDSTYECLDQVRSKFKYDSKNRKIELPIRDSKVADYTVFNDVIHISNSDYNFKGELLDPIVAKEFEYFHYHPIWLDIPLLKGSDSVLKTPGTNVVWRRTLTLRMSPHRKNYYSATDKNDICFIDGGDFLTSVCEIDDTCTFYKSRSINGNLFFANRLEDDQKKGDFWVILYVDKDVKVSEINATLKALKKIENLTYVYIALQEKSDDYFNMVYMPLEFKKELRDVPHTFFSDWINTDNAQRYYQEERLFIIDTPMEIELE